VPEDLTSRFVAGHQNAVDVLVGSNRDEGSFAAGFGPPMTAQRWKDTAQQRWGELAELGLAAYPAPTDAEAAAASTRVFSDNMAWMMRSLGAWQRAIGRRAYVYHFAHEPPYAPGTRNLGVCHTCEMVYVFENLGAPRQYPDNSSPELALASAADARMAEMTSSYWVNFARTGDPNGAGLPQWRPLDDVATGPVLELDTTPTTDNSIGPDKAKLYQAMYERLLRGL
jgi:para-nitrobenzyl esterase